MVLWHQAIEPIYQALYRFPAGTQLDMRVTTSGTFEPTTADLRAGFEVKYDG